MFVCPSLSIPAFYHPGISDNNSNNNNYNKKKSRENQNNEIRDFTVMQLQKEILNKFRFAGIQV